jgi:hypothetical protein
MLGAHTAEQIRKLIERKGLQKLEDGPVGGTPLTFGDEIIGHAVDVPLPSPLGGWNLSRIADVSLAQTAYQLAIEQRIWLPTMPEHDAIRTPISVVSAIGRIGPLHLDIEYDAASPGGIRGPFKIVQVKSGAVPTYPVLWKHTANRERTISFEAEAEGIPHIGTTAAEKAVVAVKVPKVWKTASHLHFNRDFRFNSQSTAMQFTPRKTIGGRAWLSISLSSEDHEKVIALWGNTSLGLLLHWWHANKQQAGRGNVGKAALQMLPVLDVNKLSKRQVAAGVKLFDEVSDQQLLPVHEVDQDLVRKELDEKFAVNVLGLPLNVVTSGGPLELLRMKLSREPSIRGNK